VGVYFWLSAMKPSAYVLIAFVSVLYVSALDEYVPVVTEGKKALKKASDVDVTVSDFCLSQT
jgi:hypothetical protein